MLHEFSTVHEGNAVLRRPRLCVTDRKGGVTVWLKHLRADHDGHHTGCAGETNGELGVSLATRETALRLPAHRNVAGRTEFCTKATQSFGFVESTGQHLGGQFGKTSCGQCTIAVGDAGEGVPVVDRESKGRPGVVLQIVCLERLQHRMLRDEPHLGVQVLQVRESERFTHFMPDGKEQQASAGLTQAPHHRRPGVCTRVQQVRFPFTVFSVEDAHGLAAGKSREGILKAIAHAPRAGPSFKKSRIREQALKAVTGSPERVLHGGPFRRQWGMHMSVKFGPAGVPLSCKGRTIVEGMDDIIALGLETMEVQTVRMIQPQHFDQYWQAGVLANKTGFEMNIHGPYYSELLGNRVELGRSLAKIEATLQAARTINARHITLHTGHYGASGRGREANEHVANIFAGVVERLETIWHDDDDDFPVFPWIKNGTPSKVGVETSGRQDLWGSLEEVLEVVNHVEGTVPVLNIAHIHARGHGSMRTSEDYGELFDQVRETIGTKEFYCHFSGVDHRSGNAQFYTQIKKSDLNFEPLAEFIVEDGGWLDITLISDSPLLEHDAMYMLQSIEKSRHKQIERKAREDRRRALAAQTGASVEDLAAREAEQAALRAGGNVPEVEEDVAPAEPEPQAEPEKAQDITEEASPKPSKDDKVASSDDVFEFDEDDDDLF